ncbi:hypothetical protein LguiB_027940 [Lonicera macranthoides]
MGWAEKKSSNTTFTGFISHLFLLNALLVAHSLKLKAFTEDNDYWDMWFLGEEEKLYLYFCLLLAFYSCLDRERGLLLWAEPCSGEIKHPSHSTYSLTLRAHYPSGKFVCNACGGTGDAFHYHSVDNFDLHVNCAALPDYVKHSNDTNRLKLHYNFPLHRESSAVKCKLSSPDLNARQALGRVCRAGVYTVGSGPKGLGPE